MDGSQVGYLVAHFFKSQIWHFSTLLFAFFLTEVCGLGVGTMGAVLAGSLALNGVIDAALGRWWGSRLSGAATALQWQAYGAPVGGVFFLLFCATPFVDMGWRTGWACATLLSFRASYSLVDVPQNALVALSGLTPDRRYALLAQRNIASGLAGLSVAGIVAPMLIEARDGATWFVWALCLTLAICGSAWRLLRYRAITVAGGRPAAGQEGDRVSFAGILVALAVMVTAAAAFRTIEPYHAAFAGRGGGLVLWAAIGGLVSQPLWLAARHRVSVAGRLFAAAAVSGIAAAGLVSATPVGGGIAGLGFGLATGALSLTLWAAMMTHAAAGRATGYVGLFTGVSKLSHAAGMLLLGQVLAASPYRQTLADPRSPASVLMVLALLVVAATAIALAYALNRTASGERPARPRRADRPDRGRAAQRRASWRERPGHGAAEAVVPASRPRR